MSRFATMALIGMSAAYVFLELDKKKRKSRKKRRTKALKILERKRKARETRRRLRTVQTNLDRRTQGSESGSILFVNDDKEVDVGSSVNVQVEMEETSETVDTTTNTKHRREWIKSWRYRDPEEEPNIFDNNIIKDQLGITIENFDELLQLVEDSLRKSDTIMRLAVGPREQLLVTLRYLATGESYASLDIITKLSRSYLSITIPKVCEVIYDKLKDKYLKLPTTENDWKEISEQYNNSCQFPSCIGALSAYHIEIFRRNFSKGRDEKGTNTIVLLSLVDADCKFIYVTLNYDGSITSDEVLESSTLWDSIQNHEISIPTHEVFSNNGNNIELPYVMVADNSFRMRENILTPYVGDPVEPGQNIYNQRLLKIRETAEYSLRLLKNRFKILPSKMCVKIDTAQSIVLACCALHNFFLMHSPGYGILEDQDDFELIPTNNYLVDNEHFEANAAEVRNTFSEYFFDEATDNSEVVIDLHPIFTHL